MDGRRTAVAVQAVSYTHLGGYVGYNLFSEREKGPVLNAGGLKPEMFTPEAARAAGN